MKILLYCLFPVVFLSCKKDFLEAKPKTNMVVPASLNDFQALMDEDQLTMNETPNLGEISSDDYYLVNTQYWQSLPLVKERNAYLWASDVYEGSDIDDWDYSYKQVLSANITLEGIERIPVTSANNNDWQRIKGWALFLRSNAFYNLAQVFAPPYDSATASTDLGIPLRLNPSVDEVSLRATVQGTYDQIIDDLLLAKDLLPTTLPYDNRNRPSKPAVFALLARAYLSMRQYNKAGAYADSSLQLYNTLIDYNTVSTTSLTPFTRKNDETLYQSNMLTASIIIYQGSSGTIVDSLVYQSYDINDRRRHIFFMINSIGLPIVKRGYSGRNPLFSGLATNEMYLIKAECYARAGNTNAAMNDLNMLLKNRWNAGTFIPLDAVTPAGALQHVLIERRKELIFRGLRWSDLRRLNKEGANITLTRKFNNQVYTLLPNDRKYVLPFPDGVIALTGMPQNPR